MVRLITVRNPFHARVIAARLGAEGMVTELRGVDDLYPVGDIHVFVSEEDLPAAQELLMADEVESAFDDPEPDTDLSTQGAVDPARGRARDGRHHLRPVLLMADDRSGLDVGALLNWPAAMANEVLALPDTLRSARELVADLAKLADHLAAVGDQLEHQMENLLGPMAQTVKQVNSIEASVTELRNTLFGILKRVPGARKSLIDLASPGGRADLEP